MTGLEISTQTSSGGCSHDEQTGIGGRLTAVLLGLLLTVSLQAESKKSKAHLSVKGYGFFGNRELQGLVTMLEHPGEKTVAFSANFVEDAVLIIFSRLRRDGYLQPVVRAKAELENGVERNFTWTDPLGEPLPRPF